MAVTDVLPLTDDVSAADILRYAGAVEAKSEHPIAKAIARAATATPSAPSAECTPLAVESASTTANSVHSAEGVEARVGEDGVVIGSDQVVDFVMAAGCRGSEGVTTASS